MCLFTPLDSLGISTSSGGPGTRIVEPGFFPTLICCQGCCQTLQVRAFVAIEFQMLKKSTQTERLATYDPMPFISSLQLAGILMQWNYTEYGCGCKKISPRDPEVLVLLFP